MDSKFVNRKHDSEFWRTKKKLEKVKEDTDQDYKENSNQRLSKIIAKNFETTIIGALSDFEESFGYIWGIGKDKNELTNVEKIAREVWEDVRTSILDRGNKKKRASVNEINNHEIKWKRYNYKFKIN